MLHLFNLYSQLAAGVLPVQMNVINHSQNFREANLSGACASLYAFGNLFLNSLPFLGVLFLHCLPQRSLLLCTGVL